jgi:hypothetical protein
MVSVSSVYRCVGQLWRQGRRQADEPQKKEIAPVEVETPLPFGHSKCQLYFAGDDKEPDGHTPRH